MEKSFLVSFVLIIFLWGCSNNNTKDIVQYDTPKSGTINISVDESFEPVISEEIKVYESSYPGTKIIASYKSEADCFRDLQKEGTRMIIVAKGLTREESSFFESKKALSSLVKPFATIIILVLSFCKSLKQSASDL